MKYEVKLRILLSAFVLFTVPGCGKIVDWAKDTLDQGTDVERSYQRGRSYLRSITIYDQFDTAGMFDALWLSDEVRTAYAQAYNERRAKPEDVRKNFLRRQLEENNHFITFYVLSPYEFPLGESHSDWQVFLKVDGAVYLPLSIKVVELDLEYKALFGKRHTRFKESYAVTFAAKDLQDQFVINKDTAMIELCFRSTIKEGSLVWHLYGNHHVALSPEKERELLEQERKEEDNARLEPEISQV